MIQDVQNCLKFLYNGGIILYPTDTIWGIGCDATNEKAVERIYQIKKRSDQKSMLVLLDNAGKIPSYVHKMPDIAWDLIDLADKPLTIIYPQAKNLAKNLIAPDESIGIRITNETFSQQLIKRFKKPVVSTSANISGEKAPANFSAINPQIVDLV